MLDTPNTPRGGGGLHVRGGGVVIISQAGGVKKALKGTSVEEREQIKC